LEAIRKFRIFSPEFAALLRGGLGADYIADFPLKTQN
jgi:hypothetical protein